jgi:hypothetical protein
MLEKSRLNDVAEVFGSVAAALVGLLELAGEAEPAGPAAEVDDADPEPDPQAAMPRAAVARIDVKANFFVSCKGVLLTIDCDRRSDEPGARRSENASSGAKLPLPE